ncbi:unnamed protein product, partial [Mesorhabditis spiculigera]
MPLTTAIVSSWSAKSDTELIGELAKQNDDLAQRSQFSELDADLRKELQEFLAERPESSTPEVSTEILRMLRILARDQGLIDGLLNEAKYDLVIMCGLHRGKPTRSYSCLDEAEKCLINTLHHSSKARAIFEKVALERLIERLGQFRSGSSVSVDGLTQPLSAKQAEDIWFYDLRISFVSSAHLPSIQKTWRENPAVAGVFIETAQEMLEKKADENFGDAPSAVKNRASEALKILYNLICRCPNTGFPTNFPAKRLTELACDFVRVGLLFGQDLLQHGVNLLTAVPRKQHEGRDMTIPDVLVTILGNLLDEKKTASERDLLNTYFAVLLNICSECAEARRYCRLMILPPLRASDVARRPDEGDTLRNRMVRAIHATVSRDLAAEFLFVLCKRSVPRMIKYTGFGHAAGLFADRGLLGKISERKDGDSEDSDTEEYNDVRDNVNPVSGYVQPRGENPLADMSDEQKEYEAMKLVNAIDQMMRSGGIRPATIGPDGRPREVSHVLELAKDAPADEMNSDSD